MRWLAFALAVTACGRVGFDPYDAGRRGDGAPGGGDGGEGGDGATDSLATDALPAACAEAVAVTVGVTLLDTCAGNLDLVDGCGPAGTREIVVRFTPTVTASHTIAAYDRGTQNVSNSTGRLNDCASVVSCAGIIGTTYTAGVDYYFAIEASSGGCAAIDFSIQ